MGMSSVNGDGIACQLLEGLSNRFMA